MCVTAFVCMLACFFLKPIRIRQCVSCLFLNELTYEMTFDREKAPWGFVVLTGPKDIYICVYVHCAPLQLLMNEISISGCHVTFATHCMTLLEREFITRN